MAITTINAKLALMDIDLPISSDGLGLDDKHHLLGLYPFGATIPGTTPETALFSIIPILDNLGM